MCIIKDFNVNLPVKKRIDKGMNINKLDIIFNAFILLILI